MIITLKLTNDNIRGYYIVLNDFYNVIKFINAVTKII